MTGNTPPTPEDSTRTFLSHASTPTVRAKIAEWFEQTADIDIPTSPDSFETGTGTEDVPSPPVLSESVVKEHRAYRRGLSEGAKVVLDRLVRVIPSTDDILCDYQYIPEHKGRWHITEVNPASESPKRKEELLTEAFSPKP